MQKHIAGVSPELDGCIGLIVKFAKSYYWRLSDDHKRWCDDQDVLQEALIIATNAAKKHSSVVFTAPCPARRRGGKVQRVAKMSTFLHQALRWGLSRWAKQFTLQKRAGRLLELDRPLPSGEGVYGDLLEAVPSVAQRGNALVHPGYDDSIRSFLTLLRAVSQPARVVLIKGLLFSDTRGSSRELCDELGIAAEKLSIGISDLRLVCGDKNIQKILLTQIGQSGMIVGAGEKALKILSCSSCSGRFSFSDIQDNRFFVVPMTCRACFREMQASAESCFGKVKTATREGFSLDDPECRLHCLDSGACRKFTEGKKVVDIDDVDFTEIDGSGASEEGAAAAAAKPAKTKKKKVGAVAAEKPVKPAKKKAKAKAEPVAEKPVKPAKKKAKPMEKQAKKKAKVPENPAKKQVKKAKAEKAEKPAKKAAAKKPVKKEGPEPPKGLTRWPYRPGSQTQWVFAQGLKGVSAKALEKALVNAAVADAKDTKAAKAEAIETGKQSYTYQLTILRKEIAKGGRFTWKLDESGGMFRITHLKEHKLKGD